ncbi:MAG TPA: class IV adenylate cyclase [Candidatus Acidoferrales bacterium]|nr:class IV adenylate cyclase [Candidatus Acidoferrales bacterium]
MARRGIRHEPRDRALESELKFRLAGPRDHTRLRALLKEKGYRSEGSYDEQNLRFVLPGKSKGRASLRLRILDGGPQGILTAKGPAHFSNGVKTREETEVAVGDARATHDLLLALGCRVQFSYEKHRATWKQDSVAVTLDILEFGWFVEVEGPAEVLVETAAGLGLDPARAVRDSYSTLARKFLAAAKKLPKPATNS